MKNNLNNYNASSIQILEGLEAIRIRPEMYVGNILDKSALHQILFEIIDNSIDEVLAKYCDKINIILHKDNSVSIIDNGRGIPIDIKFEDKHFPKRSAAEIVMTELHSGGKFNKDIYKISGGLHGLGLSCVNALSKKLLLNIYRNNKKYEIFFIYGIPQKQKLNYINNNYVFPIKYIKNSNKQGTKIRFWPDKKIFKNIKFNYKLILQRAKQLSFLNNGIHINILNKFNNKKKKIFFKGGIKNYIKYINKNKKIINKKIFYIKEKKKILKTNKYLYLNLAMQWNDSYKEKIFCFTNNILQKNGGIHLIALKSSITRVFNKYIKNNKYKKSKIKIKSDDIREGLVCILSIKYFNPKFDSQIKEKLISNEIRTPIEKIISNNLLFFFKKENSDIKNIFKKIINCAKIRITTKKIKNINKKKNIIENINISSKLADCQEKNPYLSELYIVEGDSAGGSAKQGRDCKFQAILPLRGKILNVQKSKFNKVLSSKQILTLISVLNININNNNFDIKNLRYKRIIIMTDADIDGAHIRTLLLTLFYKYIPKLIKKGYIYISNPPLYKLKFNNKNYYLKNKKNENKFILKLAIKNIKCIILNKKINIKDKKKIKQIIYKYILLNKIFKKLSNKINKKILKIIILNKIFNLNYFSNILLLIKKIKLIFKKKINFKIIFNKLNNNYKIIINYYILNKKKFLFIDNNIFNNKNYKLLIKIIYFLNKNLKKYFFIKLNNKKIKKFNRLNFNKIINWLILKIEKNIIKQRYKGLGEMNPNQLWKTTMNPKIRHLLKVKIKNIKKTNKIFITLMGDKVEPRKLFIKSNKINIKNINI